MRSKRIIGILLVFILIMNLILFMLMSHAEAASYQQVIINANSNNNNGIDAFPESYQILLKKLMEQTGHSNWKFQALYTDIDWNDLTSSKNENKCLRNTIYKNSPSSWFCSAISKHIESGACSDGYYCASKGIVNYFLDPRNFLTETTIFQFLNIGYNADTNTIEAIQEALNGSFMEGTAPNGERYAVLIRDAAKESGDDAFSIITRIFQELGKGKPGQPPRMVSGKDAKYPDTYNYFNYGATDGDGAQDRGLEYASNAGWNDPRTALVEGAKLIANNYIAKGQNTKYTFKFDIIGNSDKDLYSHQYMTNLQDPTNQAKILYDRFVNNGQIQTQNLTFIIPVYKNMPTYTKLPSTLGGDNLAYVSSNYKTVSFRTGPSTSSSKIEELRKDTLVKVLESNYNNTGWAKIQTEDGKIGYFSEEYLTPVNTIKDNYTVPNQPGDDGGNNNASTKGDVNGDGKITSSDYVLIKNHIMGNTNLTGNAKEMADYNGDGKITSSDYVLVKDYIMNK